MAPKVKMDDMRDVQKRDVFPFLQLPAELREQIYYFAVQPIVPLDTAAIPGTPDRVTVPLIAQVSKLIRKEALHSLFANRPVEVSLHSSENVRRALLWADRWKDHAKSFGQIIFSGRLAACEYNFFHITLECSDEGPFFRARARPAASARADTLVAKVKEDLLKLLERWVKKAVKGREGRLSGDQLRDLIKLVEEASNGRC